MIRQLALEIRKQRLNWSDLASHFRLYNYFIKSGAAEDKIESFIANVSSGDVSPDKVIALVNQLFNISNTESISLTESVVLINHRKSKVSKTPYSNRPESGFEPSSHDWALTYTQLTNSLYQLYKLQ